MSRAKYAGGDFCLSKCLDINQLHRPARIAWPLLAPYSAPGILFVARDTVHDLGRTGVDQEKQSSIAESPAGSPAVGLESRHYKTRWTLLHDPKGWAIEDPGEGRSPAGSGGMNLIFPFPQPDILQDPTS